MTTNEVTIIGTGALGSALANALFEREIPVKSVYNRTASRAEALAADLNIEIFGRFPVSAEELGDMIFITVPDDAISDVARQIANLTDFNGNTTCVHCSGNYSSGILEAVKEKHCAIAAFHPMQTFSNKVNPRLFNNIYITIEGDGIAVNGLSSIAKRLGAKVLRVEPEDKPYLHAGAVFASNYLLALLDAAVVTGSSGSLSRDEVLQAYLPLVRTTIDNCEGAGISEILSGPIARGDLKTVNKHLQLLKHNPDLFSLYKRLGRRTIRLVERANRLPSQKIEELKRMLDSDE